MTGPGLVGTSRLDVDAMAGEGLIKAKFVTENCPQVFCFEHAS